MTILAMLETLTQIQEYIIASLLCWISVGQLALFSSQHLNVLALFSLATAALASLTFVPCKQSIKLEVKLESVIYFFSKSFYTFLTFLAFLAAGSTPALAASFPSFLFAALSCFFTILFCSFRASSFKNNIINTHQLSAKTYASVIDRYKTLRLLVWKKEI